MSRDIVNYLEKLLRYQETISNKSEQVDDNFPGITRISSTEFSVTLKFKARFKVDLEMADIVNRVCVVICQHRLAVI